MEKKFGGNFFVGIFSGNTDTAFTIVRRSPTYMLYKIADKMTLLVAKESAHPKIHSDILL